MKRLFIIFSLLISALYNQQKPVQANEDSILDVQFSTENFDSFNLALDRYVGSYSTSEKKATLKISSKEDIGYIYLLFDREVGKYQVSCDNGNTMFQDQPFIHQLIPVHEYMGDAKEVELTFDESVRVSEIYVFKDGKLPSWVQNWEKPCEKADLMILSTHADDEHLFFAGTIPYYAAKNYAVQVVYITDHLDHQRQHERLNGLWTAGVTNYPAFLRYEDAWSESLAGAEQNLNASGHTKDDLIKSIVSVIRQFKPLVVMGQDFNGEYEHGQHMLGSYALAQAVERSNQSDAYTDIPYEPHDVLKTYIHLYDQNKIVLDYDTPLKELNGKTPFQVSQEAFKCHESQLYTWFTEWLLGANHSITKATQIRTYSPLKYGLYRTSVGFDSSNDLFEHVTPYFMQKPIEPEKPNIPEENKPEKETTSFPVVPFVFISVCLLGLGFIVKRKIGEKK